MSLISSRASLTHRCTIERNASVGSDDGWGNPPAPDWQEHLADEPCRVWADSGREIIEGSGTVEPTTTVHVILRADADVTEADRVASVSYRGGTVQDGPLGVRAVLRRPDHLELVLVQV